MTSQRRQNTAAHCKDEKTKAEHRHGQAPDPDQGFPEQLLRAAFALPRFCFSNKNLKKKNKESTPHDFMKTMLYHPGVSGPCRETGGCLSPSMHHRRQVQRRAGVCGQPGSTTAYTVGVRSCGPEPPPHTWARTSHWAAEPPTGRPVLRSRQSEAQPSLHAECRPWWPHVSMTPRGSGTQRLGT